MDAACVFISILIYCGHKTKTPAHSRAQYSPAALLFTSAFYLGRGRNYLQKRRGQKVVINISRAGFH